MILEAISMGFAITIWAVGLIFVLDILSEGKNYNPFNSFFCPSFTDKLQTALVLLIASFVLGGAFSIPSFISIVKDVSTEYVPVTYILRTNNVTHAVYIIDNFIYNNSYTDASYWNSENVKVKVLRGKNIWGVELGNQYEIGIWDEGD